jgi:hypothetical protein
LFQARSVAILMHGIAVGEDILYELEEILEKYELPLNKMLRLEISSPSVTGSESGVLGKLDEQLGCKILCFGCIIHRKLL